MIDLDEWNKAHPVGSDVLWGGATRNCLIPCKVLLPAEICEIRGIPVVWVKQSNNLGYRVAIDELRYPAPNGARVNTR